MAEEEEEMRRRRKRRVRRYAQPLRAGMEGCDLGSFPFKEVGEGSLNSQLFASERLAAADARNLAQEAIPGQSKLNCSRADSTALSCATLRDSAAQCWALNPTCSTVLVTEECCQDRQYLSRCRGLHHTKCGGWNPLRLFLRGGYGASSSGNGHARPLGLKANLLARRAYVGWGEPRQGAIPWQPAKELAPLPGKLHSY